MSTTNEAYPIVCRHAANAAGRDFVVGDLHGCVDALRYLLREIVFDPDCDRLFSVGDLIDRGSQSEEALALIDKPWFFPVLGNHEEALCLVAEGAMRRSVWDGLGGDWAEALPDRVLRAYARRLRTLPLVRVVGSGARRFNVLHAEFFGDDGALDAGVYTERTRQQLLWGRELALGSGIVERQAGLSPTYCGHTPMREIGRIGAQIFIDTGAFAMTGKLTVTEALTSRAWSVSVERAVAEGARQMSLP
ncbi:metallophosphoesterase [Trinickia dinghuensis]|uniref:Metallophosphoesterase n=1 Tax=Trinickia dinghuensis TaxID=2291023 RepID=A0A3D8JQX7_9BURK|nr:metallophosphoesterase [Trinickia dinghuensis]RDU95096.1 metallophosphoesterase [Trinickia dinghuensis]